MRAGRGARTEVLFRAFADRNRLRILHVLRAGEVCVGDLVQILGVPQARVSRHLAYLRKSGLVRARRSGLWMHYSLAPARGPVHRALLGCLRGCFRELPELAADARRQAALARSGGCCPA